MEINFTGGAYETFSKPLNAQECINFFTHVDKEGGTSRAVLRGTPGLKSWCTIAGLPEIRGMHVTNAGLFAVAGDTLYQIDASGTETAATTKLNTSSGPVSMAHNFDQLMIVDGSDGYIVTSAAGVPTLTTISDPDFPATPQTVTQQDGYFIVTVSGSGRAYLSDLNDGTSWNALMYFNAEGESDFTINAFSNRLDLIMFGSRSIENWYNSGAAVTFDRKPGYYQDVGLGARFSVAALNNVVFFLTNKKQVAVLNGPSHQVVSTPAIDHRIADYSKCDDAIGMGAEIENNKFYILTFPTANETLVFSVTTGSWHQLASYPEPYDNRWRGSCTAFWNGKTYVGDYNNGCIYELDFETYTDNSETIKRVRTTQAIQKENKMMFHHRLELLFESGVGLTTGQGSDPQAMLEYSDDGARTWSNEIWRGIGKIGEYKNRAIWYRLGSARQRHYRLTISDPVKCVLIAANLEVGLGAV